MQSITSIYRPIVNAFSYVANSSVWGIRQVSQNTPLVASVALLALGFVAYVFSRSCGNLRAVVSSGNFNPLRCGVTAVKRPTISLPLEKLAEIAPKALEKVCACIEKVRKEPENVDLILELARVAQYAALVNDAYAWASIHSDSYKQESAYSFKIGIKCEIIVWFSALSIMKLKGERTVEAIQLTYSDDSFWGVEKGERYEESKDPYKQTDAENVKRFPDRVEKMFWLSKRAGPRVDLGVLDAIHYFDEWKNHNRDVSY
jgi:hypothetical protein